MKGATAQKGEVTLVPGLNRLNIGGSRLECISRRVPPEDNLRSREERGNPDGVPSYSFIPRWRRDAGVVTLKREGNSGRRTRNRLLRVSR